MVAENTETGIQNPEGKNVRPQIDADQQPHKRRKKKLGAMQLIDRTAAEK